MRHSLQPIAKQAGVVAGCVTFLLFVQRWVWWRLAEASGAPTAPLWTLTIEDLAVACAVVLVWLPVAAFPSRPGLRAAWAGVLVACSGISGTASAKYYLNYETPFAWSHLAHVEGAGQMSQSIGSELTAAVLLGLAAVLVYSVVVGFLLWHLGRRAHVGPANRRLQALATTALAGAALLCLLTLHWTSGRTGRPERAHNLAYRLLFTSPGAGAHSASGLSAGTTLARTTQKFAWRASADSLTDKKRFRRVEFPARGRKLNVVIYLFEGMSFEYLGKQVRGRPVTPNWEAFARNSLDLRGHHASNPLTINAIYSILTSAFPLPMDRWVIKDFPDLPVASLPRILRTKGYRTGVLNTGYFKYAGQRGFLEHRGFQLMADVNQLRRPPYTQALNWGIDDRALIEPALRFARASRDPFFLLLIPETPHHPYDVPEQRFVLEDPAQKNSFRERSFAKYLNALHFADHVMGETVRAFEKAGLGEDTLFFLVADHGEAFGRHRGNYNHPFFIYQENMHVPFLIYNRRLFRTRTVIKRTTRHVDIPVTVLDMLGLPPAPEHQGRSVLRAGPEQIAYLSTTWRNDLVGLRDGRWKYIFNQKTGNRELYDLQTDYAERNNLATRHPGLVRRYHEHLMDHRRHQRGWYERVAGRPIDWTLTMSKQGL